MGHAEGVIAVDWGTTHRRIFLIGRDGEVEAQAMDAGGVLALDPGTLEDAVTRLHAQFGRRPMLLAGMIGSSIGWVETPYLPCPAGLDELAQALVRPQQGNIAIVPGVAQLNDPVDVMRGEEVQFIGAMHAGLCPRNGIACHPGTHAKWTVLENGKIARFRTFMTGELFSLLRQHSILSEHMTGEEQLGPAFKAGVRQGLAGDALTSDLFSIRARTLLGRMKAGEAAPYASGLLIGHELRAGFRFAGDTDTIILIGDSALIGLYRTAVQQTGRSAIVIDGEEAFLAGIRAIMERLS